MERTVQPKKSSLRIELEMYVIAWNTALRSVVGKMDYILLLRNAHPLYRPDFAYKLRDAGKITLEESKEFVRIVR